MTLLVISITPAAAVVSSDTFATGCDGWTAEHFTVDADPGIRVEGGPGNPVRLSGFMPKLTVCPQLGMVMATSSDSAEVMHYWRLALNGGLLLPSDMDELQVVTPQYLRDLPELLTKPAGDFFVAHAGWSPRAGRFVCDLFRKEDDFSPLRIDQPGHTMMPEAWPEDPNFAAVRDAWTPAAHGEATEAFHVLLARNQFAAFEAGLLRPGIGIGGQLHTARIDQAGIHIRVAHEFPGYAAARADLDAATAARSGPDTGVGAADSTSLDQFADALLAASEKRRGAFFGGC